MHPSTLRDAWEREEGDGPAIALVGEREDVLGPGDVTDHQWHERTATIECTSGEQYDADWGGVDLLDALERVGVPESTTHVVVASADGYRVCLDLSTALGSLLVFARDDAALTESRPYASRLLLPRGNGPRSVKAVERVEAVALAPGEDPQAYEHLYSDEADDADPEEPVPS